MRPLGVCATAGENMRRCFTLRFTLPMEGIQGEAAT